MSYFKSLKIKSKLLVITIIPMLTIVVYSGFTIKNINPAELAKQNYYDEDEDKD